MTAFFNIAKENSGRIAANWFISDIANQYYNAWGGGRGGGHKALSQEVAMHMACRQSFEGKHKKKKVKDTTVAGKVYKILHTV